MPRRKRHRKHGRNRQKNDQTTKKQALTPDKTETSVNKAYLDDTTSNTIVSLSTNAGDYFTPLRAVTPKTRVQKDSFEMETPVKKNSLKEQPITPQNEPKTDISADCTPVVRTPVNKRRSLNRQKEGKLNNTWNVTNLNHLFDSSLPIQNSEIHLTVGSCGDRRRSSSSIPKLHSPGKEKPLSCHKGTQTMDESELEKDQEDLITETPRASQKILTDIDTSKIEIILPKLNNIKNISNQLTKFNSDEFNINPYLKEKELVHLELSTEKSKWQKEGTAEELSFFSPQLFEMKTSSTPNDKIQGQVLLNYLKESVIRENLENCIVSDTKRFVNKIDRTPQREVVNKTPRSEQIKNRILNNSFDLIVADPPSNIKQSNVNLNTPPLTEKVINKDRSNSIKLMGSNKRRNSVASASRIHNRTSPKFSKLINHSRLLNKNLSYSRLNASQRSLLENSCELASSSITMGVYEKMINKIRRYGKSSAKWSVKMIEACAQLGIQIKNGLASLCAVYNEKSFLECSQKSCKCEEYKAEINCLNVKISSLNEELVNVKHRQGSTEEELHKLKQELTSFTDLRSELISLKEQFQCFKAAPYAPPVTSAPLPPCAPPIPPPPPPPLPPAFTQKPLPKLGLGKKAKSSLGLVAGADKGRPAITLDEILKVKLKKTSERPTTTPIGRSRNSTPMISGDLLRQVKLRPQHRPSLLKTPGTGYVSTPAGSSASSETSTSPHSSLCRMLNGDPVWKVKRLRKVSGYSFDSVRRRSPGKLTVSGGGRRDRTGS